MMHDRRPFQVIMMEITTTMQMTFDNLYFFDINNLDNFYIIKFILLLKKDHLNNCIYLHNISN
jgi:hypothetical protein